MKKPLSKKILIVGAGPGGLAAGMLLAHKGFDVEIYEKNQIPGGRNASLEFDGFKFDIGPTFFMMDFVLKQVFSQTGRNLNDYVEMKFLDPMYRLYFADNYIDSYFDKEKMKKELARVFPGDEKGLEKFYRKEKKRFKALFPFLASPNDNFFDIFSFKGLRLIRRLSFGKSLYQAMGKYFKKDFAKLSFTFQSKYLGMSPWECPAAFAMVPYVEHAMGIYHIKGGLSGACEAMAKAFKEDSGKIYYGIEVKKVITEGRKAVGLELSNGQTIKGDRVIVNADFSYAVTNLFPKNLIKKWSIVNLEKKKYSCSIFMMYFGVKKQYNLSHHSIVFAKNYRQNVEDIFSGRLTENDFSLYIRDATANDPGLAPAGASALYVLVPVPNNRANINWQEKKSLIRNQAVKILQERLGLADLPENIVSERIITPQDWERDFNVYKGAVFNLGHNLSQMLWFRPKNKFEEIDNLYLVGGGTHPGSGLPTIYQSGIIAADLICREFKIK